MKKNDLQFICKDQNKPQIVGSQDIKFYNRPKCEHV